MVLHIVSTYMAIHTLIIAFRKQLYIIINVLIAQLTIIKLIHFNLSTTTGCVLQEIIISGLNSSSARQMVLQAGCSMRGKVKNPSSDS